MINTAQHWVLEYLSIPYLSGGRTRAEIGVDCFGLVCLVYEEQLQIALPFEQIDRRDIGRIIKKTSHELSTQSWRAIGDFPYKEGIPLFRDFDVVAMSTSTLSHHVGVFVDIDGGMILHTTAETKGSTITPIYNLKSLFGYNTIKLYRHDNFFVSP